MAGLFQFGRSCALAVHVKWIILLILLRVQSPSTAMGEDWPNWRGPARNGISTEKQWQHTWPADGPAILWKATVGVGFSSVTVADGRLYTMGNSDEHDTVYCCDARTGTVIWKHTYECPLDNRFFEGGPTSTPTVEKDRVYSLSRQGDLYCLDARTGQIHWSKNVQQEADVRIPGWGFASSPMIHNDQLILNVGESGLALDKNSGNVVWKSGDGEAAT